MRIHIFSKLRIRLPFAKQITRRNTREYVIVIVESEWRQRATNSKNQSEMKARRREEILCATSRRWNWNWLKQEKTKRSMLFVIAKISLGAHFSLGYGSNTSHAKRCRRRLIDAMSKKVFQVCAVFFSVSARNK